MQHLSLRPCAAATPSCPNIAYSINTIPRSAQAADGTKDNARKKTKRSQGTKPPAVPCAVETLSCSVVLGLTSQLL